MSRYSDQGPERPLQPGSEYVSVREAKRRREVREFIQVDSLNVRFDKLLERTPIDNEKG